MGTAGNDRSMESRFASKLLCANVVIPMWVNVSLEQRGMEKFSGECSTSARTSSSFAVRGVATRSVAKGFVEIGIVADIVDFGALETYPFATDQLVVVMPRTHKLAGQHSLFFRSLLDHEFVGPAADNALQQDIGQRACL
jgi:hypothetical protein